MCVIELDPCYMWSESERRARKAHRCSCCAGPIHPGERYLVHFSIFEQGDEPKSEKCCAWCRDARGAFSHAHDEMLPLPSYFPTLLRDCIADGDPASESQWKPMLSALEARYTPKS